MFLLKSWDFLNANVRVCTLENRFDTQSISAWQIESKTWKLTFLLFGRCQVFTYSKMRGHRERRVADCWVEASSFHADSQLTTDTHLFIAAESPSHHTHTNTHTHTHIHERIHMSTIHTGHHLFFSVSLYSLQRSVKTTSCVPSSLT